MVLDLDEAKDRGGRSSRKLAGINFLFTPLSLICRKSSATALVAGYDDARAEGLVEGLQRAELQLQDVAEGARRGGGGGENGEIGNRQGLLAKMSIDRWEPHVRSMLCCPSNGFGDICTYNPACGAI